MLVWIGVFELRILLPCRQLTRHLRTFHHFNPPVKMGILGIEQLRGDQLSKERVDIFTNILQLSASQMRISWRFSCHQPCGFHRHVLVLGTCVYFSLFSPTPSLAQAQKRRRRGWMHQTPVVELGSLLIAGVKGEGWVASRGWKFQRCASSPPA